jgi:hypothetical protein
MVFLLIFLISALSTSMNIGCKDPSCLSCNSSLLNYLNKSCLVQCPTGFTPDANNTACVAGSSQSLFSLPFISSLSFTDSSIGDFSSPLGRPFNDPSRASPIPTMYQGFYFAQTSSLYSKVNYAIAPDFTLRITMMILSPGVIFEVKNTTNTIVQITANPNGRLYLFLTLTDITTELENLASVNTAWTAQQWVSFYFLIVQNNGSVTISISATSQTFPNYEFRVNSCPLTWTFGFSSSSFSGFISEAFGDNSIISSYSANTQNLVYCGFNQYISNGVCHSCDPSFATWPWCVRSSPVLCYSWQCGACSGFGYPQCSSCTNGLLAPDCSLTPNCQIGTTAACSQCISGFSLVNGLCLSTIYKYNPATLTVPVVSVVFNTIEEAYGGVFTSGLNSSTWAPFNDPDVDDPFPAASRGLYFDGFNDFLFAPSVTALNANFSTASWIYNFDGYNFYASNGMFSACPGGYARLQLMNSQDRYTFTTAVAGGSSHVWVFMAYVVCYQNSMTTITMVVNLQTTVVLSQSFFAFYDSSQGFYLGRLGTDYYNGFMYSFTLWQSAISDFSTEYNVCGSGQANTCLWSCGIGTYFDGSRYSPCNSSCISGCYRGSDCNLCASPLCSNCSSIAGSCTSCVAGATLSNGLCSCGGNSSDFSCVLGKNCAAGTGFNCTQCASSSFTLIGGLCLYPPYGFNQTLSTPVVDIVFDTFTQYYAGIFQSGNNPNTWPPYHNPEPDDPVPNFQRGLYFDGTNMFLYSNQLGALNANFSIAFWHYNLGQTFVVFCKAKVLHHIGIVDLMLSNSQITIKTYNTNFNVARVAWAFIAYSVSFVSDTTTVTFTYYASPVLVLSVKGFAFYDIPDSTYIGLCPQGSFNGYITHSLYGRLR